MNALQRASIEKAGHDNGWEVTLSKSTESVTLASSQHSGRVTVGCDGQNLFRQALMDYWGVQCAVTGVAIPEVLRASRDLPLAIDNLINNQDKFEVQASTMINFFIYLIVQGVLEIAERT